jgi:type IV secretion system protein VirB10
MKTLLIPRGSIILGAYKSSILIGQARLVVAAQRLILPNGKSVNLRGAVLGDRQGVAGMPGEIDNHFWEMFKASAVVGAASLLLPKDQQNITVASGVGGTQSGGSIIGLALSDTLTRIAQRNSNIGPTGSLDLGEPFTMMINRDLALEPYKW